VDYELKLQTNKSFFFTFTEINGILKKATNHIAVTQQPHYHHHHHHHMPMKTVSLVEPLRNQLVGVSQAIKGNRYLLCN
jgi:hypothetical protein